ncbi:hypothetical protein MUG91_G9n63 [Manis pentadactyla]|nr:hypothetical protein MUG91_G9n63 [Manis pentadactyla]
MNLHEATGTKLGLDPRCPEGALANRSGCWQPVGWEAEEVGLGLLAFENSLTLAPRVFLPLLLLMTFLE